MCPSPLVPQPLPYIRAPGRAFSKCKGLWRCGRTYWIQISKGMAWPLEFVFKPPGPSAAQWPSEPLSGIVFSRAVANIQRSWQKRSPQESVTESGSPQKAKDTRFHPAQVRAKEEIGIWGTSLVVQWLRIRLPMQGTRVRALVQEDPTCRRATKPVRHNYWACTLEPASHNYWAHMPQLLKPRRLEPVLRNKRSHCNEKPTHRNEE